MPQIVLNDAQVKAVQETDGSIELRDQQGALIGYCCASPKYSEEDVAEALRRADSDGPWYTTQQVLEYLNSLEQG